MRIRTRKTLKRKNCAIVFLFLLPLIGFVSYAGVLLSILYDVNDFTYTMDPPDTDYFYPKEEIEDNRLLEMARIFDYRLMEYNSPVGYPVDVTFTDRTYKTVSYWHHTDNGALHNAYALAAACLKYHWARQSGNTEDFETAKQDVKFLVRALGNLIAAPNGGLGINPETGSYYPGTMSRFAVSREDAVKYHPFMLEDHVRHHWGLGNYSNWRVRLKTSRDEVSGYYLGWACVLKYIDPSLDADSKWCVDHVKLMVEQVLHHWKHESNWLVLDHDGTPTGSDINSATWQLAGLRIGATVNPEKYESLYHHACSKLLSMGRATMGDIWNVANEYYAYMLASNTMYSLILLEDNPAIQSHYIENFQKTMYQMIRYHRNAYHNMMYLVFMSMLDDQKRAELENPDYNRENVLWDVKDQLWRFHESNWCPIRNYDPEDRPFQTRSTSLNPEMRKLELEGSREQWCVFFETNSIGQSLAWAEETFDLDQTVYKLPRTVSESNSQHMIWQTCPFHREGGDPSGDGLTEPPGTSYTLVYWLGKAHGIL